MSETEVQKAERSLDEQIATAMEILKLDRPEATKWVLENRPEARQAYNDLQIAKRNAFTELPISKATSDAIAKAATEIESLNTEKLAFGRTHNIVASEVDARIRAVDPTFEKRYRAAYTAKSEAERAAHLERQQTLEAEHNKRHAAAKAVELKKQTEQRAAEDAAKVPAEREMDALIAAEVAKGKPRHEATAIVMKTAKGRELYNETHTQKLKRAAGR